MSDPPASQPPEGGPGSESTIRLPERFRLNVISGYVRTVIASVTSLVTIPVLVKGLGKQAYGVWVIVDSFAAYREILQLGFAKATPKYVAEYMALGEPARVRAAVATSFWILAIPGVIALVVGIVFAAIFPALFDLSGSLATAAQAVALIVTVNVALSMPCDAFGGVLIGLQRFDTLNWTLIAVLLIQVIGTITAIVAGGGLVVLGFVVVIPNLAGQLWRYLIIRHYVPGLSAAPRYIDRALIKPFATLSMWYAVVDISTILITKIDTIVVGVVLGVSSAAVYAVGAKLAIAASQLVAPVSRVFFPFSSELAARGDAEGLRRTVVTGTRFLLGVALPLAITLSVLASPILDLWVGDGYEAAATVVVLLSGGVVISALNQTGVQMLQGMALAKGPALVFASEAAVNLVLSVVFAHLIGLQGVALGTLVASFTCSLIAFFPYMCRRFEIPLWPFVRRLAVAHAPPTAAALGVGLGLLTTGISGIVEVTGAAAAIMVAYAAVYPFTALEPGERRQIAARLRRMRPRPAT